MLLKKKLFYIIFRSKAVLLVFAQIPGSTCLRLDHADLDSEYMLKMINKDLLIVFVVLAALFYNRL